MPAPPLSPPLLRSWRRPPSPIAPGTGDPAPSFRRVRPPHPGWRASGTGVPACRKVRRSPGCRYAVRLLAMEGPLGTLRPLAPPPLSAVSPVPAGRGDAPRLRHGRPPPVERPLREMRSAAAPGSTGVACRAKGTGGQAPWRGVRSRQPPRQKKPPAGTGGGLARAKGGGLLRRPGAGSSGRPPGPREGRRPGRSPRPWR